MNTKSKKINDTTVRALEMLKMLFHKKCTQTEITTKLSNRSNSEEELRPDSLYKYMNTFKLFGINTERKGDKYFITTLPLTKNISTENINTFLLILLYSKRVLDDNNYQKLLLFLTKVFNIEQAQLTKLLDEKTKEIESKHNDILSTKLNTSNFKTFYNLCKEKQKIKLTYFNKQLDKEQIFMVEPLETIITPNGYILKAYNPTFAEIQDFSIEYILNTEQLPTKSKSTNIKNSVTFKIKNRLAANYELKSEERLIDMDENYKIISNSNEDKTQLLKRLLRYGKSCEIIYPKSFRANALSAIKKIRNLYD